MGPSDRNRRVFWEDSINFLEIDEFALNYPEPRIWTRQDAMNSIYTSANEEHASSKTTS